MAKRSIILSLTVFLIACAGYEDHLVCYDASGETIDFEVTNQQIWLSDGGYWNWTVNGTTLYRKADGPCRITTTLADW